MGSTARVIGRAAWRIGLSSAGEVIGRAVNLILPFALFAAHTADRFTDAFFLALAVAFFVHGTLANALVGVLVPQMVRDPQARSVRGVLRWAAIAGGAAGTVAAVLATGPLPAMAGLIVAVSVATMAASGIVSAPAVAALNVDHRYALPGIAWGFRVMPLAAYLAWRPDSTAIYWLLVGLALADAARAIILVKAASLRLEVGHGDIAMEIPSAAWNLILAAVISGFSPLIARWIASLGDAGTVSLFEAADRLYAAVAALATIGVGNVTLVYLARLAGTPDENRGWRYMVCAALAWSVLWLAVSIVIWAVLPLVGGWFMPQSGVAIRELRDTFVCLAVGMPGFIMTGMLGRRLLTLGLSGSLVPMAVAVTGFGGAIAALLFELIGVAGIALGLSLGQYVAAILMSRRLILHSADAHTGVV